jgi:Holliday junction resolvase RusA-like endonuclease
MTTLENLVVHPDPVVVNIDYADDDRLVLFVPGKPEPKGSAKAFVRGNRAIVVADNKETQRDWTAFVRDAARQVWGSRTPIDGPVRVVVDFVQPRRASAPKRSTPAHTRKPDGDKLTRCVWDALTHVVFVDDAQVVAWGGSKREAEIGEVPGARIKVERLR